MVCCTCAHALIPQPSTVVTCCALCRKDPTCTQAVASFAGFAYACALFNSTCTPVSAPNAVRLDPGMCNVWQYCGPPCLFRPCNTTLTIATQAVTVTKKAVTLATQAVTVTNEAPPTNGLIITTYCFMYCLIINA